MSTLQVAGFLDHSLVNGEGFRSVIFLSGCHHHCQDCHNLAMQDFHYGDLLDSETLLNKIKKNLPLIDGVTFSGGDPIEQSTALLPLLKAIKALQLSIWVYTGYTYEQILENTYHRALLPYIDVLVDGPFIHPLKSDTLKYIGSSNQRILQLENGTVTTHLSYSR